MRILVPVDGFEESLRAIDFLKNRTEITGDAPEVHIFYAQPSVPSHIYANETQVELEAYYEREANIVFKAVNERLAGTGLTAKLSYSVGPAPAEIAAKADDIRADLIIMGTRGQGAVKGFFFGSVSNAVLARTHHPVLILRGDLPEAGASMHVGLAADGSEFSRRAVEYAVAHRAVFGPEARFDLIHVAPALSRSVMAAVKGSLSKSEADAAIRKLEEKEHEEVLGELLTLCREADMTVDTVGLTGNPGHAIASYAADAKLDILILGSHGYGNFKAALLGSVAMTIASESTKPLLIVR